MRQSCDDVGLATAISGISRCAVGILARRKKGQA